MSNLDWAKEDSTPLSSDIDVRNYNITISRDDWDIFFFCFHPQVVKKGPTSYEIKKNSTVMAISFVEKIKGLVPTRLTTALRRNPVAEPQVYHL